MCSTYSGTSRELIVQHCFDKESACKSKLVKSVSVQVNKPTNESFVGQSLVTLT